MPCLVHTHTSRIEPHADAGVFFFVSLRLFLCMHKHRRLFSFVCLHVWTQANYSGCGVRASACVDASASGSISGVSHVARRRSFWQCGCVRYFLPPPPLEPVCHRWRGACGLEHGSFCSWTSIWKICAISWGELEVEALISSEKTAAGSDLILTRTRS